VGMWLKPTIMMLLAYPDKLFQNKILFNLPAESNLTYDNIKNQSVHERLIFMELSQIIFFLTVAISAFLVIRNGTPSWRAGRELERYCRENHIESIVNQPGWQLLMIKNPNLIFSEADSFDLRALKQDWFDKWNKSRRGHTKVVWFAFAGLAASILVHVLSYLI
jgi:hypothetical protein